MEIPDIVYEISHYFNLKELLTVGLTNKLFNQVSHQHIDHIINGTINPADYFNMPGLNMDDFDYPIESMLRGDGYWEVNHQSATKELLDVKMNDDHIYFYRVGENDGAAWIMIGKSAHYYFCFEASCDYTGFDCQGGGSLCYHQDWSVLWNRYMTDCHRRLLLDYYGYRIFKLIL